MNLPDNLTLPDGIRFDGVQTGGRRGDLLQFTDTAEGPAKGATFYLLAREATSAVLLRTTARVRASFRAPSEPLPPLCQRKAVTYCAPEQIHH